MTKLRSALWWTWLPAVAVLFVSSARSLEYQCVHELIIRSIAVEYQEPGQQVPCKVLYHKPPRIPSMVWQAQTQVGFCEQRAKELARSLERSGWSCDEIQAAAASEKEAPPDKKLEHEHLVALHGHPGFAGTVRSAEAIRSERATAPLGRIEAGAAGSSRKSASSAATSRPEAKTTAQRGAIEWGRDPLFAHTLARDLRKLEELTGAEVQAGAAGFGDLHGDRQPDAAVLITFDFGGTNYVQHLVVYLYREGTYRPAASRFIAGSHGDVQSAELEAIKEGMIFVDLRVLQAAGAVCCASGSRRAAFVLENGELIGVEKVAATTTP
jgi:hypothetical protein